MSHVIDWDISAAIGRARLAGKIPQDATREQRIACAVDVLGEPRREEIVASIDATDNLREMMRLEDETEAAWVAKCDEPLSLEGLAAIRYRVPLRAVHHGPTRGPWRCEAGYNNAGCPTSFFYVPGHNDGATVELLEADAEFIVASRVDVPRLLATVEARDVELAKAISREGIADWLEDLAMHYAPGSDDGGALLRASAIVRWPDGCPEVREEIRTWNV